MNTPPERVFCVIQQYTADERVRFASRVPIGVDVVSLTDNIGFAAATNLGMARALDSGADWVLLLNNDATVAPSCLDEMLIAAPPSDRIAAIAPAVVFAKQPDLIWWAGGRLSERWGITRHPKIGESVEALPRDSDTEFIPGCCVLYSAEAWRHVGGFSEKFFMYYEDAEWCLRARRSGWRLRYVGRALCRHEVGVSSGQHDQSALGVSSAVLPGAQSTSRRARHTGARPSIQPAARGADRVERLQLRQDSPKPPPHERRSRLRAWRHRRVSKSHGPARALSSGSRMSGALATPRACTSR